MKKLKILFPILVTLALVASLFGMALPAMAAEVTATKNVDPPSPNVYHVGDTIHYVMTLSNPASNTATNTYTDIHDHDPSGNTVYFVEPGVDPPLVQAPGETATFTYDYTITGTDLVPHPVLTGRMAVINRFHASGTDSAGDVVTAEVEKNSVVILPDIDVEKTVEPLVSKEGDEVVYTITVTNTGDADLSDITVVDSVLGSLVPPFSSTLAAGASETFTFPYTIQSGDPDPLVNVVTVSGTDELGGVVTDEDSATVDLVQPSIDVTKTVNPTVSKVGDEVVYTITVTNTGNIGLEGITVSDSILGDLSASFADTLAPAASESHDFPYTIQAGDPDPLVNTATVHANPLGPLTNDITDSASATVDLVHPSIDITKTVNPTVSKVGDNVTYTITITNTGDIGLEGITVSDSRLGDLSGSFADTLAPAASESHNFPYTIQAGDPDPLVNTATVHANPVGPLTNDITDTAGPVSVDLVHPSIDITKTANPTSGSVGTNITYTITVTNTGDITLENITVVDSLLGDLSGSYADTLAPAASESHNFVRAILASDPDPLVNTVTVHADPLGPLTNDITDQARAVVDITGGEGLTPGFWKNHLGAWEVYTPNQTLESVFDVPDSLGLDNKTLLEALNFGGGPGVNGAAQILLRAAVAALLNSTSSTIDYPLTTAQVISQVNTALASLDRNTMLALATQLDAFNNLGGD